MRTELCLWISLWQSQVLPQCCQIIFNKCLLQEQLPLYIVTESHYVHRYNAMGYSKCVEAKTLSSPEAYVSRIRVRTFQCTRAIFKPHFFWLSQCVPAPLCFVIYFSTLHPFWYVKELSHRLQWIWSHSTHILSDDVTGLGGEGHIPSYLHFLPRAVFALHYWYKEAF